MTPPSRRRDDRGPRGADQPDRPRRLARHPRHGSSRSCRTSPGARRWAARRTAGWSGSSAARSAGRRTVRWPSARRSETLTRSRCPTARTPRSPPGSGSPAWPAGCRSPGERRSRAARTSSCSAPPAPSGLVAVQTAQAPRRSPCRRGRSQRRGPASERASTAPTRRSASTSAGDLVAAFKEAFDGDGPSYVFDPLWGEPAAAAVAGRRARGHDREPRPVGGRDLRARVGCSALQEPLDPRPHQLRRSRRTSWPSTTAGSSSTRSPVRFTLDVERVPLDSVADAWRRQADGPGAKLVVVP